MFTASSLFKAETTVQITISKNVNNAVCLKNGHQSTTCEGFEVLFYKYKQNDMNVSGHKRYNCWSRVDRGVETLQGQQQTASSAEFGVAERTCRRAQQVVNVSLMSLNV